MPPTVLLDPRRARDHGWTDRDVLLAAALIEAEDDTCPGCRQALSRSTDPLTDPGNPAGTGVWVVGPPVRCHACTAIDRAAEVYVAPKAADRVPADAPHALRFAPLLAPRRPPGT